MVGLIVPRKARRGNLEQAVDFLAQAREAGAEHLPARQERRPARTPKEALAAGGQSCPRVRKRRDGGAVLELIVGFFGELLLQLVLAVLAELGLRSVRSRSGLSRTRCWP
jgi:hypothetical protein